MKNTPKRLTIWALVVAGILTIPYVAKFPWTEGDFIFAGVVLFGSATTYELVTKNMTDKRNRMVVGILAAGFVVAVWAWAVA